MDIASIATTLPRAKSRFCPVKVALDDAQAALGFSKVPLGAGSTPQHQAHTHRNMMRSGVFEWKTKEKRRIKELVLYFFVNLQKKQRRTERGIHLHQTAHKWLATKTSADMPPLKQGHTPATMTPDK